MDNILYSKKLFFVLFFLSNFLLKSSDDQTSDVCHWRNPLFECWISSSTDDSLQENQGLLITASVRYGTQENYPALVQEMDRTEYPECIQNLERKIEMIDQTAACAPGSLVYGQETLQQNKRRIDYNQAGLQACQQAQQQKLLKIDKKVQLYAITNNYHKKVMQNKRECCYTSFCCPCCLLCIAHGAANHAQQDVKALLVDLKKLHR